MTFLPPEETSLEHARQILADIKDEHSSLLEDIAAAKQWQQTYETQKRQLEDFSDFLNKKYAQLQAWEAQLDKADRHYTIIAETGTLGASMGDISGNV